MHRQQRDARLTGRHEGEYAAAAHRPFRAADTRQKLYPSGEYATAPGKWTFSMMERPM